MDILCIKSLEKSYRSGSETIKVLRGIDLTVAAGTTVVISGESGCGKTTLLNLTGALDAPSGGRISVNGVEISSRSEDDLHEYRNRTVGFIFQFHFLLNDFSAYENVIIPSLIGKKNRRNSRIKAEKLLKDVGLDKRSDHFPFELSGGERQRVAVARALMNDPLLILSDEPTGNLDEKNSALVEDLLFELVEKYGTTLLLVTHDQALAKKGNRHYELAHGKLVER